MSNPRHVAPRSQISAVDLEPLRVAVVELDEHVARGNRTFSDFTQRLIRFTVGEPVPEGSGPAIAFRDGSAR
jgi:hypothetical protein